MAFHGDTLCLVLIGLDRLPSILWTIRQSIQSSWRQSPSSVHLTLHDTHLQGLPVFEAPGEAEATCAALYLAGAVHAVASFDSDVLLYGAGEVFSTLRLTAAAPKDCEMRRCRLEDVRRVLGLTRGGAASLTVIAALAGCDYESEGARGVGAGGGLAVVQHLLQGAQVSLEEGGYASKVPPLPLLLHLLGLLVCSVCLSPRLTPLTHTLHPLSCRTTTSCLTGWRRCCCPPPTWPSWPSPNAQGASAAGTRAAARAASRHTPPKIPAPALPVPQQRRAAGTVVRRAALGPVSAPSMRCRSRGGWSA